MHKVCYIIYFQASAYCCVGVFDMFLSFCAVLQRAKTHFRYEGKYFCNLSYFSFLPLLKRLHVLLLSRTGAENISLRLFVPTV